MQIKANKLGIYISNNDGGLIFAHQNREINFVAEDEFVYRTYVCTVYSTIDL